MIPSEFAAFVRETGIRAFDSLAGRAKTLDKPLQSVLKSWSKLSDEKKHELFDNLIDSARDGDEPEEVKKTLPRKRKKQEQV